ncbi:MAG: sulfatase-like hydrolase/transferase, partial [Opitutales bacterium]
MNIMRPFCLLALILTSLSAHANQFTIDYASLATGSQSTRTDVVPLSSPYTIDLGNGDETITEVTVTTTAVNQDFTNAGDGLSVVGGTSDANFESEEQIHLSFSIETTLGNPVTDMDIDFLGASARAVDGDVITFSTGGDSATVTWPINTNSPGTAGLLSSIKLAFSPLQTLQVTAGPLSAAQQRTQLSSLTFELNPPRPPNVIVVLVDDLGWTDVEQDPELFPDGSPLYETPNMHRLAEEGLRFTQAYAQPLCSASRAALLSGQYSAARDFLYLA